MWYVLPDSNKQYPLTIERVRKIRQLNMQNNIPDSLDPVEVSTGKPKEMEETGFVDLVGQISLKTLEKADRKKKHGHHKHPSPHGRDGSQGGRDGGAQDGREGGAQGGRDSGTQGGRGNEPGNKGGRDGAGGGGGRDGGGGRGRGGPGQAPPQQGGGKRR